MSFGITPVAGVPTATPDAFPMGLQWQLDGANVGGRTVQTVNFVTGDELAMELDPDDSTVLNITIPAGGGAVPTLVLSLSGSVQGDFSGSDFSTWDATTVLPSADAQWDDDAGGVLVGSTGIYSVSITGRVSAADGSWPLNAAAGGAQLGSSVFGAELSRSMYSRDSSTDGRPSPAATQWSDVFTVEVADIEVPIVPKLYALVYQMEADVANYSATVTVTKLS